MQDLKIIKVKPEGSEQHMAVSRPPSDQGQPSSVFLQLFDSSFSVRILHQPTYTQLCLAQQAFDNVILARKLLVGLADIMKPEDCRNVERTIGNVEYHIRILEQNLGVLASRFSLQSASGPLNRGLQTADGNNEIISKNLEDLNDAAGLLYRLLDSYSAIQSRVMLESNMEMRKSSHPIEEVAPYVATQTLQPKGLPSFDPKQLLHYRRKSRASLRRSRESVERHEIGLSSPSLSRSSLGGSISLTPRVTEMHELQGSTIVFENEDCRNEFSSDESRVWSVSNPSSTKGDVVTRILGVRSLPYLGNVQNRQEQLGSLRPGSSALDASAVNFTRILPSQRPQTPQVYKNTSSPLYGSPHSASSRQHPIGGNILSTPESSSHTPRSPTTTSSSTSPPTSSSLGHISPLSKHEKFSVEPNTLYKHQIHSPILYAQGLRPDLPTRSPHRAQGFEPLNPNITFSNPSTKANAHYEHTSTTSLPIRPVRKRNAWLLHQIDKAGHLQAP